MIKTAKFGGSSLADAQRIKVAADIIKKDASKRYIVVSAPGKRFCDDTKITDLLYSCAGCRGACGASFGIVRQRLEQIISELGMDFDIADEFQLIKHNIESGADADYIASRGEYLIALLLARYLGYEFVDSSQLIRFRGEILDTVLTKKETAKRLEHVEYAVIPGFYGSRMDGTIKTFSRGGSDYSGALVAEAVGADLYENWTDVDGFMATDPKVIPSAIKIDRLSYDEVYRLARAGAGVLHPCSVLPLKKSKIPLHIKNTFNPSGEGTVISATGFLRTHELAGIAVKNDCRMVLVRHQTADKSIVVKRLFNLLQGVGAKIELMMAGLGSVELTLKDPLSPKELTYLKTKLSDMEITQKTMTLISLVGYQKKDLLRRVLSSLEQNSEIEDIGYNNGSDLILGIPPQKDISDILTHLYQEFFTPHVPKNK